MPKPLAPVATMRSSPGMFSRVMPEVRFGALPVIVEAASCSMVSNSSSLISCVIALAAALIADSWFCQSAALTL